MSDLQHTLPAQTKIENYRIDKVLGVGGFGVTYKGYDLNLNCAVAIKEFFPSDIAVREPSSRNIVPKSNEYLQLYAQGLQRFLDEARLLARFKLATVVRVNGFLKANGTAYIIMDYEDGLPLSLYLRSCKVLSEDEILNIVLPVLTGLRGIHAHGILHRDIKPPNIYLRKQGLPVLLDFGSARQSFGNLPATNMVTPGYAPFEQYNTREKQGPWTDLYSVGATLYRCISGNSPMSALDRFAGLKTDDSDPLPPAKQLGEGRFSDELLSTTDWMLDPLIENRPKSVDEVLERFSNFADTSNTNAKTAAVSQTYNNVERDWDQRALGEIEAALTRFIGPIAKVVIENARATALDTRQLCRTLADEIEDNTQRDKFLHAVATQMLTGNNDRLTTGSTNQTGNGNLSATIWDESTLRHAETELAKYLGPLAPTLVRKAADQCMTMDEFLELLSDDIPTAHEREVFRSNVRGTAQ